MKISDITFKNSIYQHIGTAISSGCKELNNETFSPCIFFEEENKAEVLQDVVNYLARPACDHLTKSGVIFITEDEHNYYFNQIVERYAEEAQNIIDFAIDFEGKKFSFLPKIN